MRNAIVVGSGADGATVAKELQGSFEVTVLEAGREFRPLSLQMPMLERLKRTRLLFDEREIQIPFPAMRVAKTGDGMVLVRGRGLGGTTTLSTGNGLRMDGDLKALGINLDAEFRSIYREIPVTTGHQRRWRNTTSRLFDICQEMSLGPEPTPKMGDYDRCANCGRCVLGCPHGVKWDSRQFLRAAIDNGARLMAGWTVERVVVEGGRATGVEARKGWTRRFFPADLVVLSAGGLGTPLILEKSGIACEPSLFVDPVLCVAGEWKGSRQWSELPMPFVVQRDRFILSPYFDYLSFLFNRRWRHPAVDTLGIMIKLADCTRGSISTGGIDKNLTPWDRDRLKEGVEIATAILGRLGVKKESMVLGTINAGHPGGMLPLTAGQAESMHDGRLPENLYVADATLLPRSLGNPPILSIVALAKRVSRVCREGSCSQTPTGGGTTSEGAR